MEEECREAVIRFQVENENKSADSSSATGAVISCVKSDAASFAAISHNVDKADGEGSNKLGRLFFKVR